MSLALFTLATADHFQHYLPLYAYAARKYVGEDVDIHLDVLGKWDDATGAAFDAFLPQNPEENRVYIHEIARPNELPEGGSNLLRFLLGEWMPGYDVTLITDCDLLLLHNPFPWHLAQIDEQHCFAAHHGPYRKPYRPEVSGPDGWRNNFERVAGGFVAVTPRWYEVTRVARKMYADALAAGSLNPGWREMDEVYLARIIKESGLQVPTSKFFPPMLRGVHLGDTKDSMTHRWTNMVKMASILTSENCAKFRELEVDPVWQELLHILKGDEALVRELGNLRMHIQKRGL